MLLCLWRRPSIVSPFFQLRIYGLQILVMYVNSCHLINSSAELELPAPTLPNIFSNSPNLGSVAHVACFPGTNIYGIVSSSINRRIPSRVVSLLSVLNSQEHTCIPHTHTCIHTLLETADLQLGSEGHHDSNTSDCFTGRGPVKPWFYFTLCFITFW